MRIELNDLWRLVKESRGGILKLKDIRNVYGYQNIDSFKDAEGLFKRFQKKFGIEVKISEVSTSDNKQERSIKIEDTDYVLINIKNKLIKDGYTRSSVLIWKKSSRE